VCFNGDFPIASGGNGHQVLDAKAVSPETNHYIFDNSFLFYFISLYGVHSLSLDFKIWQNFTKRKNVV